MISERCTWCRFLEGLYARDMAQELKAYIQSMPEEIKTDEAEYERRLGICAACDRCRDGICGWCGCFVAARAVKKQLDCPYPGASKWQTN